MTLAHRFLPHRSKRHCREQARPAVRLDQALQPIAAGHRESCSQMLEVPEVDAVSHSAGSADLVEWVLWLDWFGVVAMVTVRDVCVWRGYSSACVKRTECNALCSQHGSDADGMRKQGPETLPTPPDPVGH